MSAGAKVAQRLAGRLVLLALLAMTGGCFTTLAWGGDPFDDEDRGSRPANRDDDGPSLWESLALTPFTLVLDAITMPVQLFLLSDDDDDDRSRSRRDRSRAATGSPNTPGTTLRSH